jgi:MFS family permease
MSDGFVTVAQCVEGLPTGTFAWELLFCGFLAWFLLGAINEFTPMAFSFLALDEATSDEETMLMSAALALGNFIAIVAGGWVADRFGRTAVIRPALLMTVVCGTFMQAAHTFRQLLACRFALGLASGGLLGTVPPLLAELLPSRNRGFYLTIWCSGWPAGALFAIMLSGNLPGLHWRFFYTVLLLPAAILYVCSRADMLPESPRYLYMVGRRDEGYEVLADMYEKEELPLPWAADTISVTCSHSHAHAHAHAPHAGTPLPSEAPPDPSCSGSSSSSSGGSSVISSALSNTCSLCGGRSGSSSGGCASEAFSGAGGLGSTGVAIWLSLTMFCASSAAQSMKLWMPTMLVAQRADLVVASAEGKFRSVELGALGALPLHFGIGLDDSLTRMQPPLLTQGLELPRLPRWQEPLRKELLYPSDYHSSSWHFADGPESASLLQQVRAPLMMHNGPNKDVVIVLVQAYLLQVLGVVACAYASTWINRRRMVQCALPAAALLTLAVLGAAGGGAGMLCGPLMGLQLAAQAAALNFLQVFATEYFPTSRRAKIVALVMFAGQLGNFTVPVLSGFIVHRISPTAAVVFFSSLYILSWILSLRLPLPSSREHPLHDVDKHDSRAIRKRDWTTYQAI